MSDHSFPKSLRLTNKKKFASLFESGKMVKAFPFKLIYHIQEHSGTDEAFQIAFTVPKRSFKKAVDRNFIRRRMKEAFRLNGLISDGNIDLKNKSLYAILIYTNREKMDFHSIEKGWIKIKRKFAAEVENSPSMNS